MCLTNNVCHQLFNVVLRPGPRTRSHHMPMSPPEGHSQGQEVRVETSISISQSECVIIITSWPTCPSPPAHRSWPSWAADPASCPPCKCSPAFHQPATGQLQGRQMNTQTVFVFILDNTERLHGCRTTQIPVTH